MNPLARLALLVLPLIGLAGAWGWTHVRAQQGVEWDVPVSASGPRASLRGRFIAYRYDWSLPVDADIGSIQVLCLEGTPPALASTHATYPEDPNCRNFARAVEGGSRYSGLDHGQLYIPQEQVPAMRRQLADDRLRAVVRIRVNASGAITPLWISFRGK
jgi:hypothetical protein